MTKAHIHMGKVAGHHVLQLCHPAYTKCGIGSVGMADMAPAEGEERRPFFVADGHDFASTKNGYQPKFIGAYPSPEVAEGAVRMHAYYQGNIDDPDLFERAEIRKEDIANELAKVLSLLIGDKSQGKHAPSFDNINLFKPAATPQVSAEDANKKPEKPSRELPPELAQVLAEAPADIIDFIMKANDAGAIQQVAVFKMEHPDHLN